MRELAGDLDRIAEEREGRKILNLQLNLADCCNLSQDRGDGGVSRRGRFGDKYGVSCHLNDLNMDILSTDRHA